MQRLLVLGFTTLAIVATGCRTSSSGSQTKDDTAPDTNPCDFYKAIPGFLDPGGPIEQLEQEAIQLVVMGVPQAALSKNVCSCIFVAGTPDHARRGLDDDACTAREMLINLTPGAPTPMILDTHIFTNTVIERHPDPQHPGEYIATVSTAKNGLCASIGAVTNRAMVATYSSYGDTIHADGLGPRYGCTLSSPDGYYKEGVTSTVSNFQSGTDGTASFNTTPETFAPWPPSR